MTGLEPTRADRGLALARIGIGLAHGVGIYILTRLSGDIPEPLFGALALSVAFVPIVTLGGLGALPARTLGIWLAAATVTLAALGAYEGYVDWDRRQDSLRPQLFVFAAMALFIAHHLVLAAAAEGRWIASYARYFDEGWRDGVRLALGAAFVGAMWLLLFLGASLF